MLQTGQSNTEIRMLPMPDGTFRPYRGDLLLWKTFDYIQEVYNIEAEWLVNLANIDVEENGVFFEDAFDNIVAYVCREHDKAAGRPDHF